MGWLLHFVVDLFWDEMVTAAYRKWGLLAGIAVFLIPFAILAAGILFLLLLSSQ